MPDPIDYRPESLLRLAEVRRVVPLSRSSIYRMIDAGEFPMPVKIGPRAAAWRWADLREWIASRQPANGRGAA